MDKEEVSRLVHDYGIEASIINDIYDNLCLRKDIKEEDILELLEIICFDYMHLDVQSGIDEIPEHEIEASLNDDNLSSMAKEIIEEQFDRVNDLSDDLASIIETDVTEYLNEKNHVHDPNSMKDIYNN